LVTVTKTYTIHRSTTSGTCITISTVGSRAREAIMILVVWIAYPACCCQSFISRISFIPVFYVVAVITFYTIIPVILAYIAIVIVASFTKSRWVSHMSSITLVGGGSFSETISLLIVDCMCRGTSCRTRGNLSVDYRYSVISTLGTSNLIDRDSSHLTASSF